MNSIKYIFLLLSVATCMISCSREKFADMNTDPDDVLTVAPELEFTSALTAINSADFEYYYDYNRAMYYWTQTFVAMNGAPATVYDGTGNLNQRYSNFYTHVGNQLKDVQQLIEKKSGDDRIKYTYLHAITYIPLAYYASYVSDVQGSIPYTEAFLARYTGLLTPKYDAQDVLFDTLQAQLKRSVAILKSSPTVAQANLGSQDVYFGGKISYWIKAANSLRLRLAMRLVNRDAAKMQSLVQEILADDGGLISSNDENWQFESAITYAKGGNYNPESNGNVSGARNYVDFMANTADPRIRIFFQPSFTKDEFDSAHAQKIIPDSVKWDGKQYRGQFANPDKSKDSTVNYYYSELKFSYKGASVKKRWVSEIQDSLFYNPTALHSITFPIITYADVCFMRAELAVRGLTNEDAQSLYYAGITASVSAYDRMGKIAGVTGYKALSAAEVSAYLAQTGVKYDPANALEQICVQEYINSFRNQNEAWATIKRTGFPSKTGNILQREPVVVDSDEKVMPRRFAVSYPSVSDLNYANRLAAIESMVKVSGFSTPDDIKGRVWWDTAN
ncbi:SusD/RagB family nutrient-binding outer membrane lipoprotein [Chitinophaga sancti]|uniref:SusD/RagB family nutrient-binding outer membrane lipoprotein n=1 Tax=Chitinophaga sancti TaxID=1004 RepID=UPI003F7AF68C